MNDFGRRVNSIIVKNLPTTYTEKQLEELFSEFGRILSVKVLPVNPNFDGGYGFVNYADADGCQKAIEGMNECDIDGYTLIVSRSSTRTNGNGNDRSLNGSLPLPDDNQPRFQSFRPASERSPTSTHSSTHELDTLTSSNKPLWNSQSPLRNAASMDIREHPAVAKGTACSIYLSNLEVPNVIFAATLDDYVNATSLIAQMNRHELLVKVQATPSKSKFVVGQCCAALFNSDWYRARVLEVEEHRAHVQYIDWGNTSWCDLALEIRPLPNELYKDAALCVKCLLNGVPTEVKPSDEQTNAILDILVLDVKLEMTVVRIENSIPYVQLNLGDRNLNAEICALLPQSIASQPAVNVENFDSKKPEVNLSETHLVQLTTVDTEPECFHVLLMRDCLSTIMSMMKDWSAQKQPLASPPKPNMLVCAQYQGDDLWYRAWTESVTATGYRVYFVDFGNEEIVTADRLSECPDALRDIPWQSVQIKLARIQLTDEERYFLLREFETDRLEMKIVSKSQDIFSVDLIHNNKSLSDHMLELRKKKEKPVETAPIVVTEAPKPPPIEVSTPLPPTTRTRTIEHTSRPTYEVTLPEPPPKVPQVQRPIAAISDRILVNTPMDSPKVVPSNGLDNDSATNLISEQRRQNRLLEQVIAAINTTNALLTQLVQREITYDC